MQQRTGPYIASKLFTFLNVLERDNMWSVLNHDIPIDKGTPTK